MSDTIDGEDLIEAGILLMLFIVLIGIEALVWRLVRGPAERRRGTAYRAIILTLVTLPLAIWCVWAFSKSREFQLFGKFVKRVPTSVPVVALTFDDGPEPVFTDQVLAILDKEGVKATFFVVGQKVQENLVEARRIVAEGHEMGNHTYSHPQMIGRSYSFVQQEIEETDKLIRLAGYDGTIHFRPPGSKRLIVLPYYLWVTGRTTILMDIEPESFPDIATDADKITEHVLGKARPGSIILLHVMYKGRAETVKALPRIIQGLKNEGYGFVTVSQLLALGK
jgi:peptidoglycan/xylan/chitin deacetylase (PgdA/CDA1 family)